MDMDIYFQKEWQLLFAEREGCPLDSVQFENEYGSVEYSFLRRPIVIRGEVLPYTDIMTPYAFAGPLLKPNCDTPENNRELAVAFDRFFDDYCRKEGIVSEYCQFSPWLHNHEPFSDLYELDFRSRIAAIDLTKPDIMMDELHRSRRRKVRAAMNCGIDVIYDYTGERIDDFLRLYNFTIEKYDAIDYYRFDRAFIEKTFDVLKGQVHFVFGVLNNICISAYMVIESDEYSHAHLAGHDPETVDTNVSSLLIYDAACKAQQDGKKLFVLGGSGGNMWFKETFTKNQIMDYYAGKRIRLPEVYQMLSVKNGVQDTVFFPKYRDNGEVQYNVWTED